MARDESVRRRRGSDETESGIDVPAENVSPKRAHISEPAVQHITAQCVIAGLRLPPRSNPARKPRRAHRSLPYQPDLAGCSNRLPPCRLAALPGRYKAVVHMGRADKKGDCGNTMTELRYLAPDTLDEAIGAFAKAGSAARILAGGTDLLVQMRSGVLKPGVIVDIKKIPEMTAIEQTADGGFRIGAAVSGMALAEHKSFRQGLARRARGRQPDRFQAGAGPRVRRRQSLQRLARRRQRARDGRRRRHRHRAGPERPPRDEGGGRPRRSRPHQSESPARFL